MKLKFAKYIIVFSLFFGFTLLQTGCGNEEEPQVGPSIAFASEVEEASSRAPMIESSADEDFVDFSVWGNYTEGGSSRMVFTDQLVARAGSGWGYSPAKSWILTATQYDSVPIRLRVRELLLFPIMTCLR